MRLDKYLSDMGRGTRSEIRKAVRAGRVLVDGVTVRDPGMHIPEGNKDGICMDGEAVTYEENVYYMLNKPAGIITASADRREPTVLDLLEGPRRKDLYPVGRLDRDTEGLLLITNDGKLGHRLLSPGRHVDKVYYVKAEGLLPREAVRMFADGLQVDDTFKAMPADLRILKTECLIRSGSSGTEVRRSPEAGSEPWKERWITEAEITIREGKYHQVKRMFEAVGCCVTGLKRLSMGPLKLDPALAPGEYRKLTQQEILMLKEIGTERGSDAEGD